MPKHLQRDNMATSYCSAITNKRVGGDIWSFFN